MGFGNKKARHKLKPKPARACYYDGIHGEFGRFMSLYWFALGLFLASCSPNEEQKPPLAMPMLEPPGIGPSLQHMPCRPDGQKLVRSVCEPGYVCVPVGVKKQEGQCLKDCGENNHGRLMKRDICGAEQACMLLKDHELVSQGMFCLTPQVQRDEPCLAPFDEHACGNTLTCLPTASYEDDGRTMYGLYRCKEECSQEKPCGVVGEQCRDPAYARFIQQPDVKRGKKTTRCSMKACRDTPQACSCAREQGYYCQSLMDGLDVGNCVKKLGVCLK